jgi:alpha-D-ribose 1-methylphosphonate 5-triphosphate diphosphatase PhnM
MALNETEQKRYDDYRSQLEKLEAGALANELAMIFVFVTHMPIQKIIDQAKENTRIIRHNKRVTLKNKKHARLKELVKKRRWNKIELKEIVKLCRDLGIEIPEGATPC